MSSVVKLGRRMALGLAVLGLLTVSAQGQTDPLPSWNDAAAKRVIVAFVTDTTTAGHPSFVPRIRAYRDVRSGRHAVGREADLYPGPRTASIAFRPS